MTVDFQALMDELLMARRQEGYQWTLAEKRANRLLMAAHRLRAAQLEFAKALEEHRKAADDAIASHERIAAGRSQLLRGVLALPLAGTEADHEP